MLSWYQQRRLLYIGIVLGAIILVSAVPVYKVFFNKTPTCFDMEKNQDEIGTDCGGVCALLCPFESRDPIVMFERLYKASLGSYTVLAVIENPNQGVFIQNANFIFRVYDKDNVLLFEKAGSTFVPPGRVFPIFAYSINTGYREADHVSFAFVGNLKWEKGTFVEPKLNIVNVTQDKTGDKFKVTAGISNDEAFVQKDVPLVITVYDTDSNIRAFSGTTVDYISPHDSAPVVFNWNEKFNFEVGKIDITPRIKPRDWQR